MVRTLAAFTLLAVMHGAAFGQPARITPAFDIADVHHSALANNPQSWMSGGVLRGGRYDLRKATMLDLIRTAYNVDPDTTAGGPAWLEFDRYDIAAKAPASTTPETVRLMLQSLLADRFQLVRHHDTRPMPGWALKLGKGKPKMAEATGSGDPGCRYQPQSAGAPLVMYACRNITMAAFAQELRGMAGSYIVDPVADSTGLAGAWDFDLQWNNRFRVLQGGAERTTFFDALEKQLGLELSPQKTPAPVIVVDRVNESPTPNSPDIAQLLPPRELEFEVASVRPSRPEEKVSWRFLPNGLEIKGENMRELLGTAFDIHWDHIDEMIAGAPKWIESAHFDILAKSATETNGPSPKGSSFGDDDLRLMLRALLVDRFRMKTHYEDRLVKAYTLVAAKPRLKKADPANRAGCREARTLPKDPRDLNPRLLRLLSCQNVTMEQFAQQLLGLAANDFAYPVEDATGLEGAWDFTLNYTPVFALLHPDQSSGTGASDPGGGLSIADAMRQQLGVKLELRKRRLPVLVIDHIEEKPMEN
jgi:uncharacterized protein (TIGR03435 family)